MDSCHAGALSELELDFLAACVRSWDALSDVFTRPLDVERKAGRPYFVYVQSWTSPKKPERTSARARMRIPIAYV